MSNYGSWSVKGIDDRARAVAKEKARLEGVTLGDYINNLLLQGHSEAGPRDYPQQYRSPAPQPQTYGTMAASLDELMHRIEASEARSTLAITGIDQSVLGLLARLEDSEHTSATIAADLEAMVDEVRETQEALRAKMTDLDENDRTEENLQAMKALEHALGKLADHVFEESKLSQDETSAIKGRMESGFGELSERVDGIEVKVETTLSDAAARVEKAVQESELRAEGTSRHLSERFSAVEASVATKLAKVDEVDGRVNAIEGDVSGAITSMESTLVRVQERLNRAETTTDAALKALEQSFASLDQRIEAVAGQANPEREASLRQEYEDKFNGLANELRLSIDETRLQLASEIEQAAAGDNSDVTERIETAIGTLQEQLLNGEERSNRAIEEISEHVTGIADEFNKKVHESERRSAAAIEQVGEQVATAITRIQARQDESASALTQSLATANEANETRLSAAISNISDRLSDMQNQTVSVMSPVQKAIISLAARLDSVEEFTAPPHSEKPQNDLPTMPEIEAATAGDDTGLAEYDEPDTELSEDQALPDSEAEDEEFIAGLPELDASSEEAGFENTAYSVPMSESTEWPEETEAADADYVKGEDVEDTSAPQTVFDDAFEEADAPFMAFESDNSDWNDGRDEARDSDIFSDDFTSDLNALRGDEVDLNMIEETDPSETDLPDLSEPSDTELETGLEVDQDATNYLARARRAAISAAEPGARPGMARRSAATGTLKASKTTKPNRVPAIAAASALAFATAGAGAAYITLRGSQDAPLKPMAVASIADKSQVPPAEAAVLEPSLSDVSYDENQGGAEDVLFDEVGLEQGSMAPEDDSALMPTEEATDVITLPTIAPMQSLESAAAAGDPIAEFKLGESLLGADNFTAGPDYVRRAAEKGLPAAQYRLAKLHETGLGVPRDLVEARQWTEKAAKGGNVKAMHDLAVFYADGDGGPQSYAGAVEWFRKAADSGIVDSQYNLAVLYENGLGISPSNSAALFWYEVAARNGDATAQESVTALRRNLSLEEAQSAQSRAANWQPNELDAAANGTFPATSWNNGTREQIADIQTVLNGLGYQAGTPDGLAGPGTRTAIRAFQADANLPTSGEVNPALIEALNAETQSRF
ncbi:MAG: SEL1-like repeat protein [Henriciella sp.]